MSKQNKIVFPTGGVLIGQQVFKLGVWFSFQGNLISKLFFFVNWEQFLAYVKGKLIIEINALQFHEAFGCNILELEPHMFYQIAT